MPNAYRIVAVPSAFADAVRSGRIPSVPTLDGGRHQCRHCLTLSTPDETVLLASYSPFGTEQPYAERGPVFVHERPCARYAEDAYPPDFPKRRAVIRAYDSGERLRDARVVGDADVENVIAELLAGPETAFLHARNVAEGCFMFRIEPAGLRIRGREPTG
jgi:hypothetical protein